jgi:CHAT domain-containing protein
MVAPPIELGPRLHRADLENGLRKLQRIAHEPALTPALVAQQIALAQTALKSWRAAFLTALQPWLARYAQVLIAPDGLMSALPFACLYDETNRRYFCETHAITLTPSLALWPALSSAAARAADTPGGRALIVGASFKGGLSGALPAAVAEAHAVAGLFTAPTLLTEQAATVEQFIQAAPHAQLIYLAAHGEYHRADPAASFIELADGPLCVRDILALRLAAPVVVLNACDTSRGYLIGNELMGLVRGFFYAGAAAVVAAQWQVEDVAASSLMTQIMHEVQAGEALAHALQRAQQRCIQHTGQPASHPFFWGAFSVTGAGNRRV